MTDVHVLLFYYCSSISSLALVYSIWYADYPNRDAMLLGQTERSTMSGQEEIQRSKT